MKKETTLPIPETLLSLACDTISRRISRLPFFEHTIEVTREYVRATMECLNAEFTKTLLEKSRSGSITEGKDTLDSCLDDIIPGRGIRTAKVIADVLCRAGIAERTEVLDRRSRTRVKGIRLLPAWTWHIVSKVPRSYSQKETTGIDSEDLSRWTSLCPVCKIGILNLVTGQQLFGIRPTNFFECTNCGAKFIPDNKKFRCVAVTTKKDPLWNKYLNRSYSPDEWYAIARGMWSLGKRKPSHIGGNKQQKDVFQDKNSVFLERGGRLELGIGNQSLYFIPIQLHFGKRAIYDLFSKRKETLGEIIRLPPYHHLAKRVNENYRHYLEIHIGLFLFELKTRKDDFFHAFLNPYGDETYCTFRIVGNKITKRKGAYIIVVNGTIKTAGASFSSFLSTINEELGSLTPQSCYLDGNPSLCHANSLVCRQRTTDGLFVYPVDDVSGINRLVTELNRSMPFNY